MWPFKKQITPTDNRPVYYCRDCKFVKEVVSQEYSFAKCSNPRQPIDLVSGEVKHYFCSSLRDNSSFCGPSGRWFEPVNTEL
jgi:hypothetical protein